METTGVGQAPLQGGLLDRVSSFAGGNREAVQRTLNAAIPATMYAVADHGSSEIGARGLLDGLRSGQAPQLEISQLGSLLGNPQASEQLLSSSGGYLERILGPRVGVLIGALSSVGDTDRSSTSKLLAVAAALVLGVIGRRAREDGLDAGGLAGFLSDQKSKVASLVPGPTREAVGLPAVEARPETTRREKPVWPMALLALAVLVGLVWFFASMVRSTGVPVVVPRPSAAPTTPR